jgi:predicted AAA+ superfamily ATPase
LDALVLKDYSGEYLKEEIQAEGTVRNLAAFSRLLEVAAIQNGQILSYESIGRETGVSGKTAQEYFQILIDTLIGFYLPAWTKTVKRRSIQVPKFYFFDCGIPNALLSRSLSSKTPEWGQAFEHFMILETRACAFYEKTLEKMNYWRSHSKFEVDLLIDGHTAEEFKTGSVRSEHTNGLIALSEDLKLKNLWIVGTEPDSRRLVGNIEYMNWKEYLSRIQAGSF